MPKHREECPDGKHYIVVKINGTQRTEKKYRTGRFWDTHVETNVYTDRKDTFQIFTEGSTSSHRNTQVGLVFNHSEKDVLRVETGRFSGKVKKQQTHYSGRTVGPAVKSKTTIWEDEDGVEQRREGRQYNRLRLPTQARRTERTAFGPAVGAGFLAGAASWAGKQVATALFDTAVESASGQEVPVSHGQTLFGASTLNGNHQDALLAQMRAREAVNPQDLHQAQQAYAALEQQGGFNPSAGLQHDSLIFNCGPAGPPDPEALDLAVNGASLFGGDAAEVAAEAGSSLFETLGSVASAAGDLFTSF